MKNIGVVFGGTSTEHDVSVISGLFVSKNIDRKKYHVINIYIDKDGNWYEYKKENHKINFGEELTDLEKIPNIIEYLKKLDCIFPVLHGLYGEDGTIQGLLEITKIPYVGCKVLASSIAMDKVYTKIIFEKANLPQVKYRYIRNHKNRYIYVDKEFNEKEYSLDEITEIISKELKYPLFVKPSNFGSSVGITKAKNKKELYKSIKLAKEYDKKILIEEGLEVRELECAILGNEKVITSCVGEVISGDEFYDYDSKYNNIESITIDHADISEELENKIKEMAKKAFKAIDGKGLSRVDFFLDKNNNIYINEINTLPGFTGISMYPKLFKSSGIEISELITRLIELAFE